MSRIEDVALAAGVSTATVSRALRGLPKVSEGTRERVLDAAARLEYVASPTASSLASGKTRVVGVVVPCVTRWYYANLLAGASRVLREHGYHVLLFDVGDNGPERSLLLDQGMVSKRVDAVLVFQLQLHDVETDLLRRLGIPVVTVGTRARHWSGVRVDDVRITVEATRHLIALGHRDIAYVGGDPAPQREVVTPTEREQGFRQVMAEAGLPRSAWRLLVSDWTLAGGVLAGRELLGARQPPTAVVAASDEMAIGVLLAARELGVDVPRHLSVIGVDDHDLAVSFDLTTMRQPVREQGEQASRMLLRALDGPQVGRRSKVDADPREHLDGAPGGTSEVLFETELVVRGSTAAPPGTAEGSQPAVATSLPALARP